MSQPKTKIAKHASLYMVGDIIRHSVSLIMLPIYTRYLTPSDYGTIELLSMLIDFATIIFGARVSQAVFRYYCTENRENERHSIISSAIIMSLTLNGVGMLAIMLTATPLSLVIFSDTEYSTFISLFAITILLIPAQQIPLTYIRAEQRPALFLGMSLLKLAIQLSLNIYLVVVLEMHVEGVIYSALASGAFMSLILLIYTISKTGFSPKLRICKSLFNFSLPLKLASIATFYLTFGDRYILKQFTSLHDVGIYALGYKFGFIFTLLAWTPFEKIWDTEKYKIHKGENAKKHYQSIFILSNTYMILIGLGIALFSKDMLIIMSASEFHSAYSIVPIIIVAYLMQAWSQFCNLGLLINNKTSHIAFAEYLASVIITIAYLSLIPTYGVLGAAIATAIGFFSRFYLINASANRLYNMLLPWHVVAKLLITACAIYLVSLLLPENIYISITVRAALFALFVVAIIGSPLLPINERNECMMIIKKIIKR